MSAPTVAEMVAAMDGQLHRNATEQYNELWLSDEDLTAIRAALLRAERIAPYVQHRPECAALNWCAAMLPTTRGTACRFQRTHAIHRGAHPAYNHEFEPQPCTCGLAEAQAAKESE